MAILTWKNIARAGDTGTDATIGAGKIFDKAFERFADAGNFIGDARTAGYEKDVAKNTQQIAADIRSLDSLDDVEAARSNTLNQADNRYGNRYDRGAIDTQLMGLKDRVNDDITKKFNLDNTRDTQWDQQPNRDFAAGLDNITDEKDLGGSKLTKEYLNLRDKSTANRAIEQKRQYLRGETQHARTEAEHGRSEDDRKEDELIETIRNNSLNNNDIKTSNQGLANDYIQQNFPDGSVIAGPNGFPMANPNNPAPFDNVALQQRVDTEGVDLGFRRMQSQNERVNEITNELRAKGVDPTKIDTVVANMIQRDNQNRLSTQDQAELDEAKLSIDTLQKTQLESAETSFAYSKRAYEENEVLSQKRNSIGTTELYNYIDTNLNDNVLWLSDVVAGDNLKAEVAKYINKPMSGDNSANPRKVEPWMVKEAITELTTNEKLWRDSGVPKKALEKRLLELVKDDSNDKVKEAYILDKARYDAAVSKAMSAASNKKKAVQKETYKERGIANPDSYNTILQRYQQQ